MRLDDVDGRDAPKTMFNCYIMLPCFLRGTFCNRIMRRESPIISKSRPCFIYLELCNLTAPKTCMI